MLIERTCSRNGLGLKTILLVSMVFSTAPTLQAAASNESVREVCILYSGSQDIPFPIICFLRDKVTRTNEGGKPKSYILDLSRFDYVSDEIRKYTDPVPTAQDRDLTGYYAKMFFSDDRSATSPLSKAQILELVPHLRHALFGYTEAVGRLSEIEMAAEATK